MPAGALLLLHWFNSSGASLPPALSAVQVYAPYAALALAFFMSAWFNRGRALLALLCLAIAQFAYGQVLGADAKVAAQVLITSSVLVPLNLAALAWSPERGVLNSHGLRRLFLIIVQPAAIVLLMRAGVDAPVDWLAQPLPQLAWLGLAPTAPHGVAITIAAVIAAGVPALTRDQPMDGALCGAAVAFALACHSATQPSDHAFLTSTAALLIMIGVLQDSYRMAFRDDLTGLPSRRALNERMMSLGQHFTIAMVDIDYFKRVNDTYGHETGDHVLKMVAAKLSQVRSGGRAFRYGGEEFALLFPNRSARRVQRELEALRISVEKHRLALRNMQRPLEAKAGRSRRGSASPVEGVAVTISIGLAERTDAHRSPEQVLQAADRALYRAKEKGRNRLSR